MTNQVAPATSYLLTVIHKLESTQMFLFLRVQDESASVPFRWRKYFCNINWIYLCRIIKRWEKQYSLSTHKVKHTHTSMLFLDLFFSVAEHFRMPYSPEYGTSQHLYISCQKQYAFLGMWEDLMWRIKKEYTFWLNLEQVLCQFFWELPCRANQKLGVCVRKNFAPWSENTIFKIAQMVKDL